MLAFTSTTSGTTYTFVSNDIHFSQQVTETFGICFLDKIAKLQFDIGELKMSCKLFVRETAAVIFALTAITLSLSLLFITSNLKPFAAFQSKCIEFQLFFFASISNRGSLITVTLPVYTGTTALSCAQSLVTTVNKRMTLNILFMKLSLQ